MKIAPVFHAETPAHPFASMMKLKGGTEMALRLLAASFLTAFSICAQAQPRFANFYSVEKERALGASEAQDLRRRTTPLNNSAALDYVQNMGARLADQISHANFSYTFAVIKEDQGGALHEPVALPGGYIFVPASLFLVAQSEAEFAGMLAHAMEHAAARHATRESTRSELFKLTTANTPPFAQVAQRQAIPLAEAAFHRNNESEADLLAVDSMHAAGYDPQALASYIDRLQSSGNGDPASDLPDRYRRVMSIGREIQKLPPLNA